MELDFNVRNYNQFGELLDDGIFLHIDNTFSLRFDDPTEFLKFGERICKLYDDVIDVWNDSEEE